MWTEPLLREQSRRCVCSCRADISPRARGWEDKPSDDDKRVSSGLRWQIVGAPGKLLTPPEAWKAPRGWRRQGPEARTEA